MMKIFSFKQNFILLLLLQSSIFYSQNFPIVGFGDAANYTIGYYTVPSSSGLDLHWYGGIRFGDHTSNSVMQITNGNVGIGTTTPSEKLQIFGNLRFIGNGIITSNTLISEINSYAGGLNQFKSSSIKFFTGTYVDQGKITFNTSLSGVDVERVRIEENGNVGIGTTNPTSKLTVAGNINSREVKVTVDAGADFVFENEYNLPSLDSVDKYIKENKHLPEIASAEEMKKNGINLSEMNIKLLQKIEEMTLYMIEQNKQIMELKNENQNFKLLFERLSKIKVKLL